MQLWANHLSSLSVSLLIKCEGYIVQAVFKLREHEYVYLKFRFLDSFLRDVVVLEKDWGVCIVIYSAGDHGPHIETAELSTGSPLTLQFLTGFFFPFSHIFGILSLDDIFSKWDQTENPSKSPCFITQSLCW